MIHQLLDRRYKIIQDLRSGGMGRTFLAEDTRLPGAPTCVVKQLRPASTDSNFLTTARRLFAVEAEVLQQLGSHDQIPRLLAYFEQDQEFYLVQEFIDGHSLDTEMPLCQRWTEPQVIQLLQEVLTVLDFVHSRGVIHRDIKPTNLIRRKRDGKIVLIDFGAVKQVQTHQTATAGQISATVAIGTLGYMPTEQASGKPRTSSDLYALGMVAIQALTGLLPTQLQEDDQGEIIWRDQLQVSQGLANFLTKMVRHYFVNRYQTAGEALQALQNQQLGYTPTQTVNHGEYTPTEATPAGHASTPTNLLNDLTEARQVRQPKTQPSQNGQTPTLNQQKQATAPQYGTVRSSSLAKLLLAGVGLSSILVVGVIYLNSTRPQPQPGVQVLPSSSVEPVPASSPPSFPIPIASPSPKVSPITNTSSKITPTQDNGAAQRQADAEKQRQADAEKQRQADAEKQRQADAEKQRQADAEKQRQADAEKQRQADAALASSNQSNSCPSSYSPAAFQGRTAKVAFANEWSVPITVVLYHPSNGKIFNRYTITPGNNTFLGNDIIVGDDWGVCFENKPNFSGFVNNLGVISDYNNFEGAFLFQIQNPRSK